jgi:two-component system, cell cycle sensor histidine kinase and response regulator CckA
MLELEKGEIRGNETILVVEDEDVIRNLTMRLLLDLGYDAIVVSDGFQAIEVCKQRGNEIKLLLTDMIMPGMSGDELAANIKKVVPAIKIIFMSGYTDSAFIQHKILESQADYIQKPFRKEMLGLKLREVLDRQLPESVGQI